MCLECGFYKGKMVIDMSAKKKSREDRLSAKKEAIKAQSGEVEAEEVVPEKIDEKDEKKEVESKDEK